MKERIEEIRGCLEYGFYHAALGLALTLPDICGQVKYPTEANVGKRYIDWFDEYVYPYYENENACESYRKYVEFNGSVCYQVRCRFLHNNDLNTFKESGNSFIRNFHFCVCSEPEKLIDLYSINCLDPSQGTFDYENAEITLDIKRLCLRICEAVEFFYKTHSNPSAFLSHEIIIETKVPF